VTVSLNHAAVRAITAGGPVPAAPSAMKMIMPTVNPSGSRVSALFRQHADCAVGVRNALRILRANPPLERDYPAANFATAHEQHTARCLSIAAVCAELSVIVEMLREWDER
jgi:hypothetical protein